MLVLTPRVEKLRSAHPAAASGIFGSESPCSHPRITAAMLAGECPGCRVVQTTPLPYPPFSPNITTMVVRLPKYRCLARIKPIDEVIESMASGKDHVTEDQIDQKIVRPRIQGRISARARFKETAQAAAIRISDSTTHRMDVTEMINDTKARYPNIEHTYWRRVKSSTCAPFCRDTLPTSITSSRLPIVLANEATPTKAAM